MNNDRFLDAVLGLISIDSVAFTDENDRAPYGTGPAKALEYTLNLCKELGIKTENCEGKTAWAEIGEGDEIVGILGHLDVVPYGDGWKHNPKGEICEGRLYGRGVVDDKGPTMAALFAMKEIQDSGIPLKRRVRLIFGQCEEGGDWKDMEYYKSTQQLPVFGFTPDADFPAIYGEKGILNFELSVPVERSGLISVNGGDASNMVPDWCSCSYIGKDGTLKTLEAHGCNAHASTPEKGENAISILMQQLDGEVKSPLAEFYRNYIGFDYYGNKMGCGFEDVQSGKLTLNAGTIRTAGNTIILTIDIRNPVTYKCADVEKVLIEACGNYGILCRCTESMNPIYMDKNGEVVQALIKEYRSVTGDTSEPIVIGGGTYARAMPGIVAFGPMKPDRESTEHQKDEYILIQDLLDAKEIYRRTIEKLANMD